MLDQFLHALGVAGDVLDTPGAMVRTALTGNNPLDAIFDTSRRKSGRDVLEHYGAIGPNQDGLDAGDAAGFLAEMILDPTNLVGAGIGKHLLKKVRPIRIPAGADDAMIHALLGNTQRHTLEDITNIANKTGTVPLFHGAPANNATRMVSDGIDLPPSGSAAASNIAKTYGIPWTEWKHRVEPGRQGSGYGDEVRRLSTAPPDVAGRWASHFPQGEIYSDLNTKARLYLEAKRRGMSVDDLEDIVHELPGPKNFLASADKAGAPDLMKSPGYGHIVQMNVDGRAIPRGVSGAAASQLEAVTEGEMTMAEMIDRWNRTYRDIKVHPQNVRSMSLVSEPHRQPFNALLAALLGHNAVARQHEHYAPQWSE